MLSIVLAICFAAGITILMIFKVSKRQESLTPQRFQELRLRLTDEAGIRQLLSQNKIQAIKAFRRETGASVLEAREAMDYMSDQPSYDKISIAANQVVDKDNLNAEVISILKNNNRLVAIKYYRQHAHVGLKEAKSAVDQIAQGIVLEPLDENKQIDVEKLQCLIQEKKKIEAISYYRKTTGVGLKEAKEAVEWLTKDMLQRSTM